MDELTRLAVAARDGDGLATAAFIRRSQADVWRLCSSLVDRASADDLTQDTYVRALRSLSAFRAESSARTWLLVIARRTCADALRRRGRRRALAQRIEREPRPAAEPARGGAVDLELLLADLGPDRREAFVLTQVLGLGYAEAAEVIGCPVGTVRSRIARAREQLVAAAYPRDTSAPSAASFPTRSS